ncbi:MAG: hypothetical protein ACQETL_11785 [Bacteroidota bacterium]
MKLELRNKLKSVSLLIATGNIEKIEYPDQLDFQKHEPRQFAGFNNANNIKFYLQGHDNTLKEFKFYNSGFDFREGHTISIITSSKTYLHRIVINHNTQRYWLTNSKSISSESIWEKHTFIFILLSLYFGLFFSLYFLMIPHFENQNIVLMGIIGIALLTALLVLPKIYSLFKINRNQFLYEKRFRPQLKAIARKLLNDSA